MQSLSKLQHNLKNVVVLIKKTRNKFVWFLDHLFWILFYRYFKKNDKNTLSLTIGIVTFMDRYENCLQPLIKKIVSLFPNSQIIVAANGHVKKEEHLNYLSDLNLFCNNFKNLRLITHVKPQGLSYLWNQVIKLSENKKILLLNDDIKIKLTFKKWLYNSKFLDSEIALINSSWSHFLISEEIIKKNGWFDEGFKEIGGEDDDYAARLAINNIRILHFKTQTITSKLKNRKKLLSVNSYGKNMKKEMFGYSTFNYNYLHNKWQTSQTYFEGATEVPNRSIRFWKLRN